MSGWGGYMLLTGCGEVVLVKAGITVIIPEVLFVHGRLPHSPAQEVYGTTENPPHTTQAWVSR